MIAGTEGEADAPQVWGEAYFANHEPAPTAERFIDLLFPQSMPAAARETLQVYS